MVLDGLQGCKVCQPVVALAEELLPIKEDGRLQSRRFGGFDAQMPGYLVFRWI